MTSSWLPPTGGPESPRPGWAPPGPPDPARSSGFNGSVVAIVVGVIAVGVGVTAMVLQSSWKLDAETVLTGGTYLREEYRLALLLGGGFLAVFGLASIVSGALTRGPLTITLTLITGLVMFVVGCGLALAIVAVSTADDERPRKILSSQPATALPAGTLFDAPRGRATNA